MNKGDVFETIIEDLTSEGAGLGRADGMAVFVQGTIPGDKVRAGISKLKKNYAEAKLIKILEESPNRIEPACPCADKCGGCSLQAMSYEAQLELKRKQVESKLARIGGIDKPLVHPVIGMVEPYKYRNKGEYPAYAKDGKSIIGFYERKSHMIVDVDECMLQSEVADAVTGIVRKLNPGAIKQVVVRTAFGTGEVMAILECLADKIKNLEQVIYAIDEAVASVDEEYPFSLESVYTVNNGKYKLIAGKKTITDSVEFEEGKRIEFEISAPSFYQVNTEQMINLYNKAAEYAGLTGTETLLDIYCGIGTIGLSMVDKAKQVIGIEIVKEAVVDANRNATINGIVNARYICGRAEDVLPACADSSQAYDEWTAEAKLAEVLAKGEDIVAVLDPPRAGCDEALLETIADAGVARIVYISCDPGTLARDVKLLGEKGYKFEEATPVDMFPWTGHVETVALLSNNK